MKRDKIDITWFPNSWVRIRTGKKVIYFDPAYLTTYFSGYDNKTEFSRWPDPIDGLPNGLEKADYIFIAHHHKDHCKRVTTQRLISENTKVFAPKSCDKELGNMYVPLNLVTNTNLTVIRQFRLSMPITRKVEVQPENSIKKAKELDTFWI